MLKFEVKNRKTGFKTHPTVNVKNEHIAERILYAFYSIEKYEITLLKGN